MGQPWNGVPHQGLGESSFVRFGGTPLPLSGALSPWRYPHAGRARSLYGTFAPRDALTNISTRRFHARECLTGPCRIERWIAFAPSGTHTGLRHVQGHSPARARAKAQDRALGCCPKGKAMSFDTLVALVVFAAVGSITPGPNNLMLLASGVNFGLWRSLPHILGIGVGFLTLLLGIGLGLGALLTAYPPLHAGLKIAGGAYLLFLAWKIASARTLSDGKETGAQPLTFMQAAAFQWVNPKAWVIAITGMALYTDPARGLGGMALVAVVFALTNLPCISSWALFGVAMRNFLSDPVRLKWFNIAMGVLLAATLWPLLR